MVKVATVKSGTESKKLQKSGSWIEIPTTSRTPKPFFASRPSPEVVIEIKQLIRSTREPWMVPHHTHTKPPKDSRPVYLGEFDLPQGYLTPCPCCSPNNFKFGSGKIAWFPDEHVVRLIGPQCFRTLNAELHEAAMAVWEKEKKEIQAVDYLLARRNLVEGWLRAADEMIAMAKEADRFFPALKDLFEKRTDIPLYSSIKDGHLKVWTEQNEFKLDESGRHMESRIVTVLATHGYISGPDTLSGSRKIMYIDLSQARTALSQAGAFSADYIKAAPFEEKNKIAKMMRTALRIIKQCRDVLDQDCLFLRAENLQALRNWAKRPDAQLQFDISFKDGRITVEKRGRSNTIIIPEALRVRTPPAFEVWTNGNDW